MAALATRISGSHSLRVATDGGMVQTIFRSDVFLANAWHACILVADDVMRWLETLWMACKHFCGAKVRSKTMTQNMGLWPLLRHTGKLSEPLRPWFYGWKESHPRGRPTGAPTGPNLRAGRTGGQPQTCPSDIVHSFHSKFARVNAGCIQRSVDHACMNSRGLLEAAQGFVAGKGLRKSQHRSIAKFIVAQAARDNIRPSYTTGASYGKKKFATGGRKRGHNKQHEHVGRGGLMFA